ncbi:MAG TPA: agmatine deiminase family protein [Polyangiaceae bacterium]|nr:agmatine deiminase family protein [Polyangiaceae bacterium]
MSATRKQPARGRDVSPRAAGFSMPAEWAPHEATWLAFPHHRTDFPGKLHAVIWTFAEMARVLTQAERVRMLVEDRHEAERAARVFERAGVNMERVDFVVAPTNRSWTRDSMPLWVTKRGARKSSEKLAVKFRFDGWSRYRDHQKDDAAGRLVARKHSAAHLFPALPDGSLAILEGGSIDVDGEGSLLTTSECLLTSPRARFGHVGRAVCEQVLCDNLGVEKILWLPNGVAGDDTSGHVDDFARFAPKAKVLVCDEPNRRDENHAPLLAAQRALAGQTNARGRRLEVVKLPMPAPVVYDGNRLPASYANFLVANAAVLVPVFNDARDRDALAIIAECYPDRPTVGIYARDLVVGLGTLHCSSMQEPA